MMIRYLDAGLFFVGLYWTVMLAALAPSAALVFPVIETAIAALVMVEAFGVLSRDTEYLVWSHRALIFGALANSVALTVTLLFGCAPVFPFFASVPVACGLAAVLIAVKLILIRQIVLIRDRRDKRYELYVRQLELNG